MDKLIQHRFKLMLSSLVTMFVMAPLLVDSADHLAPVARRAGYFAITLFFLLAGALVVTGGNGSKGFLLVLIACSIVLELGEAFLLPGELTIYSHALRIVIQGYIVARILRHLFEPDVVTFDTLAASMCVFLVMGLFWMNVYVVLETLNPGSFVDAAQAAPNAHATANVGEISLRMLYFSLTTLTTVGFGDIVPRTGTARMFAVTEALVGQSYLLIMVSRLVGLHVSQNMPPNPP